MRILVQRSNKASVVIDNKVHNSINSGLVLLVGFTEGDNLDKIKYLAKKVVNLRIFPDENSVMNKSILDYGGEILSISQFTLYADTSKGNRPSYIKALGGEEANKLYEEFNKELEKYIKVKTGIFGADMEVNISNIGPTTIILER
ncbi:MAG: D-tyrosyl-tRNA(Tyr) deacylase [Bacilli bacterium]|nr:D-tyrosyl-tRNA(Tyr) deacylase [Bacilli bacterium]